MHRDDKHQPELHWLELENHYPVSWKGTLLHGLQV